MTPMLLHQVEHLDRSPACPDCGSVAWFQCAHRRRKLSTGAGLGLLLDGLGWTPTPTMSFPPATRGHAFARVTRAEILRGSR